MAKESTQRGKVEEWERLIQRINANAQELAYLEVPRARLEAMLAGVREVAAQQAALTASKQEASQKLKTFQVEGERIATLLRGALKQHYGIRSEKLAEFDLKPFRGRKRNGGLGVKPRNSPAPEPATPPVDGSHEPGPVSLSTPDAGGARSAARPLFLSPHGPEQAYVASTQRYFGRNKLIRSEITLVRTMQACAARNKLIRREITLCWTSQACAGRNKLVPDEVTLFEAA